MSATASLLLAATLGAPEPSAVALARQVQERLQKQTGLTARFIQTYRSAALGREIVERGVVSLKRPGRMRWEYKDPEKKTFVSDGRTLYFYVPADRQVMVRDRDEERGIATLLLSGRSDILGQFQVSLEKAPFGFSRLRLLPRRPDPEIEEATIDVDESFRVRVIEVKDAQGNRSRFQFDDLREDVALPDRLFQFEIPRGVEVITG